MDNGAVGNVFTTFDVVYKEQARLKSMAPRDADRSRSKLFWQSHLLAAARDRGVEGNASVI